MYYKIFLYIKFLSFLEFLKNKKKSLKNDRHTVADFKVHQFVFGILVTRTIKTLKKV